VEVEHYPVVVPLFRPVVPESIWLTPEVFGRTCDHLPWHLVLAARAAVLLLLRMRTLLSLKWCFVFPKQKWAQVERVHQKTKNLFGFALTDPAIEVLRELRAFQRQQWEDHVRRCARLKIATRQDWDTEHVFTWKGRKIDDCNTAAFQRALRLAGAPEGANWHSLRHTGATWGRFGGLQLADLQAVGGWRSIASVQRYAHIAPQLLAPASNLIARDMPRLTNPSRTLSEDWDDPLDFGSDIRGISGGAEGDRTLDLRIANANTTETPPDMASENKRLQETLERLAGDALRGIIWK